MPYTEAAAYVRMLNDSQRIPAEERSRIRAEEARDRRVQLASAYLPSELVTKYERLHLAPIVHKNTKDKKTAAWDKVRRLVMELEAHPSEWATDCRGAIAAHCQRQKWSWDYCKRILTILNTYGLMYCRALGGSYEPVKLPHEKRVEIQDAVPEGSESAPIQLHKLASLYGQIPDANWNWLWIAFWFGLRPHELPNEEFRQIPGEPPSAEFYMPKLRLVRKQWRYKQVPALMSEQLDAMGLLSSRMPLERPTTRQLWAWFGKGYGAYGCRHGFAVFMYGRAGIETLSRWLGHRSVTTTERYYVQLGLKRSD